MTWLGGATCGMDKINGQGAMVPLWYLHNWLNRSPDCKRGGKRGGKKKAQIGRWGYKRMYIHIQASRHPPSNERVVPGPN